MEILEFKITGMSCAACSAAVERVTKRVPGVENCNVNLATEKMRVRGSGLEPSAIMTAVEKAGFQASPLKPRKEQLAQDLLDQKKESDLRLLRLILSAVFSSLLITVSMGHMVIPDFLFSPDHPYLYAFTQIAFLIPILFLGRQFYIRGIKNAVRLHPNMDTLISLGTIAAIAYSTVSVIRLVKGDLAAAKDMFWESAGTIVTLVMLGKYFEFRSKKKTVESIQNLIALAPDQANLIVNNDEIKTVPTDTLMINDILLVKPGERIPADGMLLSDYATVDESMLTGESMPVEKKELDTVSAGSINGAGTFRMKATSVGEDTSLSKIISLVEEAQGSKAPISRLADRISSVFVPVVLCIATIVFFIWFLSGETVSRSLRFFISVLVIACPCALGLATPTAIMVGTGRAAKNGILIRNGAALENIEKLNTILLDKTGTITQGKPSIESVYAYNTEETEFIKTFASCEKGSEHPLGKAVLDYAQSHDIQLYETKNYVSYPGRGASAQIGEDVYYFGNKQHMLDNSVELPDVFEKTDSMDGTVLYLSKGKLYMGCIVIKDIIKEDAPEAVSELKKLHIHTMMLTGDNEQSAKNIAKQCGIDDYYFQLLPADKSNIIKENQRNQKIVGMVGDGINDAIALTQADIGFAIGTGTDVAISAADVVLMQSRLDTVVSSIKISNATMRIIKQNLFWAFFYNCISIPIAAGLLYAFGGPQLSPMIAALCMSFSSVTVLLNALRLKTVKI